LAVSCDSPKFTKGLKLTNQLLVQSHEVGVSKTKFEKLVTQTPLEKPKIRESLLPFLTVKEALLAETTKPLWKHGTALRTRY
jgi:hypothetical protein